MAFKEIMLLNNRMEMMDIEEIEEKCILNEFDLYDPLRIDMKTACQTLLSTIDQINQQNISFAVNLGQCEILSSYIMNVANYETKNTNKILDCISDLLLNPSLTLIIANLFRPILIDLVSRWSLSNDDEDNIMEVDYDAVSKVESVANAYSLLLPIAP